MCLSFYSFHIKHFVYNFSSKVTICYCSFFPGNEGRGVFFTRSKTARSLKMQLWFFPSWSHIISVLLTNQKKSLRSAKMKKVKKKELLLLFMKENKNCSFYTKSFFMKSNVRFVYHRLILLDYNKVIFSCRCFRLLYCS